MSNKLVKCKVCGQEIAKSAKVCPHCGAKVKHRSLAVTIIVGVFSFFVIVGCVSNLANGKIYSASATGANSEVTLQKFDQVETGMSYEDVVAILGFDGELNSQVDIGAGSQYETEMYTWQNPFGSNMNVTFQGGKVVSKAQIGLK